MSIVIVSLFQPCISVRRDRCRINTFKVVKIRLIGGVPYRVLRTVRFGHLARSFCNDSGGIQSRWLSVWRIAAYFVSASISITAKAILTDADIQRVCTGSSVENHNYMLSAASITSSNRPSASFADLARRMYESIVSMAENGEKVIKAWRCYGKAEGLASGQRRLPKVGKFKVQRTTIESPTQSLSGFLHRILPMNSLN